MCALSNNPGPAGGKGDLIAVGSHHGLSHNTGHWTTNWSMPGKVMVMGSIAR